MLLARKRTPKARPYQIETIEKVKEAWAGGAKRILATAPTGSGKSLTMGFLIKDEVDNGGKVLVVTDRKKLTRQFARGVEDDFGIPVGIEMAGEEHGGESVICSTVQTITNRIANGKFHPDEFSLLAFDEAHLAMAKTWQDTYNHFNGAKLVGLTATPYRSDRKDLMKFFEEMVEVAKLDQLIQQGWLSPLVVENIPINIGLKTGHKTGDYDDAEIASAIEPYLASCADELAKRGKGKCCLTFLPLVATSRKFTKMLNDRGLKAEHVDGTMDEADIEAAIRRLEAAEISCLSCSMLLTVGVDIRPVNLICNLRPTRSWTLFVQVLGRGTRLYDPAEHGGGWPKKTECTILDPLWQVEEHSLLQRPSRLFAVDDDEAEAMDNAIKKMVAKGGKADILAAKAEAQAEREERLRQKLEAMAKRKARTINPLEFFTRLHLPDFAEYEPLNELEARPISFLSQKQREWLEKSKFDMESIKNMGQAKKILDALGNRAKEKRGTIGQIKYAQSLGFDEDKAWDASFDELSQFIEKNKPAQPWAKWKTKR